jgi:transglutaminase-like putative cysteine protease
LDVKALDSPAAPVSVAGRDASAHTGFDLLALGLWVAAVLVAAMVLPAANWTDDLGLVPVLTVAGLLLGVLLVTSRFSGGTAFIVAVGYGLVFTLWQMTATLDPGMPWRERVFDLAGRILLFLSLVLNGEPSQDPLMFVLAMSLTFWVIAVFGTWRLFRRGGLWIAVMLPGLAVFLNVYYYRYGTRLQIYLPIFLLVVLALIVRTELIERQRTWKLRRAQIPPDISTRVTQAGIVAALLLVGVAWLAPEVPDPAGGPVAGASGGVSVFGDFFSDALAGLRSPVNLYGETFAESVALGAGRDPGQEAVFRATAGDLLPEGSRAYWRARVYDTYQDGAWTASLGERRSYRPREASLMEPVTAGRVEIEFVISPFVPAMKLLYLPAEFAWINRSADIRQVEQNGAVVDVLEAVSAQTLVPGDSYRVRSRIAAPSAEELQTAGRTYPEWVRATYLQLPRDLPRPVVRLASEITQGASTPYEKARAITAWLRANIRYQRVTEEPPVGTDPVEWFLFDSRVGFCDYYASAAVLMLRAVGVPARFAAGFAEGSYDPEANQYFVSSTDSHSWPEVYFPGYGWVEFEPTVSQPPLDRPSDGSGGAEAGPSAAEGTEGESGAASAGAVDPDLLALFGDIEDIQLPGVQAQVVPWAAAAGLALGAAMATLLFPPARRFVARAVIVGTKRAGARAPAVFERWAAGPASEATAVFRRLAAWPSRLGFSLTKDATPSDRGEAVIAALPGQRKRIAAIIETYSAERYGGRAPVMGEPWRTWKALRPHLYRARLARILESVIRPEGR